MLSVIRIFVFTRSRSIRRPISPDDPCRTVAHLHRQTGAFADLDAAFLLFHGSLVVLAHAARRSGRPGALAAFIGIPSTTGSLIAIVGLVIVVIRTSSEAAAINISPCEMFVLLFVEHHRKHSVTRQLSTVAAIMAAAMVLPAQVPAPLADRRNGARCSRGRLAPGPPLADERPSGQRRRSDTGHLSLARRALRDQARPRADTTAANIAR